MHFKKCSFLEEPEVHSIVEVYIIDIFKRLTSAFAVFSFFFFTGFSLSAAVLSPSRAYNLASMIFWWQKFPRSKKQQRERDREKKQ